MQVTWSAAAGQLQLNTKQHAKAAVVNTEVAATSEEDSQEQFVQPRDEKEQLQYLSSTSNEELKAGLCLRQEYVSIMVRTISDNFEIVLTQWKNSSKKQSTGVYF